MYKKINNCRICGNKNLISVFNLGFQALTGVFPKEKNQFVTNGPLELVKCMGDSITTCGLLQLAHSYELSEMYGDNYGYRSSLNISMSIHLNNKIKSILEFVDISDTPIVLDIGSNDGTTLSSYPCNKVVLIGFDPTSKKFRDFHPPGMIAVNEFFTAKKYKEIFGNKKARIITSFSMFYDLESPMDFVRDISDILDNEGVWVFEQSYMPAMLENNSYDTICHEHLEYYSLIQIVWMLKKCNLKIISVSFNKINGGSFSITASLQTSSFPECTDVLYIIENEYDLKLDTLEPYTMFAGRCQQIRDDLVKFVEHALVTHKRVAVLGASTKGNVILQYCGFNQNLIESVGEVNPDKFGSFTPGTLLPIIDENVLLADEPDFLIVLPWHFAEFFKTKYKLYKAKLVFPMPKLTIF